MPEGPEIKWIINNINEKFSGSVLKNIKILSGKYKRHGSPTGFYKFNKILENNKIKILSFNSKGKFIWLELSDQELSIWITFGLTGEFTYSKEKHSHIEFITNKGEFYYTDMRNFGTIKFSFKKAELTKKLNKLGYDPIDTSITINNLKDIFKNNKKPIAVTLMEQNLISGIGNYLRAEILYDAKLNPYTITENLDNNELERLKISINKVMRNSYKKQLKNGLHTYEFAVYNRKETNNGEKIFNDKLNNRTIWYVKDYK